MSVIRRSGEVSGRCGLLVLAVLAMVLPAGSAEAQIDTSMQMAPGPQYKYGVACLNDANLKDAYRALKGSAREREMRVLGEICYEAMKGECCLNLGNYPTAMTHYAAAIECFRMQPNWMTLVEFSAIRPSTANPQTPWGMSPRPLRLGHYSDTYGILCGRLDAGEAYKSGGAAVPARFAQLQVQEVIRCMALAIRRRGELLGPLARHDPMLSQVAQTLSGPVGNPGQWSQAWIDLCLGTAFAASGRDQDAVAPLTRSIAAGGEFEHPMTGMALLQLGIVAQRQNQVAAAAKFYSEATFAAYHYNDVLTLEEAFRRLATVHIVTEPQTIPAPLLAAIKWTQSAQGKNLRLLRATLSLAAAECYLQSGQSAQADTMLADARAAMLRREIGEGMVGARLEFLAATSAFQQRNAAGNDALAAAMTRMQKVSRWLYQIRAVNDWLRTSRDISMRSSQLYREVLRDPTPADWIWDPMESMAKITTPQEEIFEYWFVNTLRGTAHETTVPAALQLADRVRRHRFLTGMAMGGRLLDLRWLLEAPEAGLDPAAVLQRKDVLAAFPAYVPLLTGSKEAMQRLASLPIVATDDDGQKKQTMLWNELAKYTGPKEAMLREMAVRRVGAGSPFPPIRATREIQRGLPPGTAMLAFFNSTVGGSAGAIGQYHAFLLDRKNVHHWVVQSPLELRACVGKMLRAMGNADANRELEAKDLADTTWLGFAKEAMDQLTKGSQADFAGKGLKELVIVPDGFLWYLPFECLPVSVDGESVPLARRIRIRYAPMASLGVADARPRKGRLDTAAFLGRMVPGEPDANAKAAFERLAKAVPGAVALDRLRLPAPSALLKTRVDQLIVWDDLAVGGATPLSWAPLQVEAARGGSTLNDWLHLPFGAPDVMVLPGYHTMAENPAKRTARGAWGSEMYFSVLGMLASGSRTVLLSRWRTGGQTAYELTREFAQELPQSMPSESVQRAMLLVMKSAVDVAAEPRIKKGSGEVPKADSPFFWAGYMLVDPGEYVERKPGEAADDELTPPARPGEKAKPGAKGRPGEKPKAGGAAAGEMPPDDPGALAPAGNPAQPAPEAKAPKGKAKPRKNQ